MKTLEEITTDMLRDHRTWPLGELLCVKKGQPLSTGGKCGVMLRRECGEGRGYIVRNHPGIGEQMYGGPFAEKFSTIAEFLNAGWVVD